MKDTATANVTFTDTPVDVHLIHAYCPHGHEYLLKYTMAETAQGFMHATAHDDCVARLNAGYPYTEHRPKETP